MTAIEMQQILDQEKEKKPIHCSQTAYELSDALRKERYYKDAALATSMRNRDIYIAYYVEKQSYRKIAERYLISPNSVRVIIRNILAKNHRKNAIISHPATKPWLSTKLSFRIAVIASNKVYQRSSKCPDNPSVNVITVPSAVVADTTVQ